MHFRIEVGPVFQSRITRKGQFEILQGLIIQAQTREYHGLEITYTGIVQILSVQHIKGRMVIVGTDKGQGRIIIVIRTEKSHRLLVVQISESLKASHIGRIQLGGHDAAWDRPFP